MRFDDPAFWRAGAISTVAIMSAVLIMLTINSLAAIRPGGANVPLYTVINQHIDYEFDAKRGHDVPVIGRPEPLFGKAVDAAAAEALIDKGKMVIQSRACMNCHTFFGNGAYFCPRSCQGLARSCMGNLAGHHGRRNARKGDGEVPHGAREISHLDPH